MTESVRRLLAGDRAWVNCKFRQGTAFLERSLRAKMPDYMWIGCSDCHLAADEIMGLASRELIVHHNIANLVVHTDMSLLSAIEYALMVLKVNHLIVCGHYSCKGVKSALEPAVDGVRANWLRHLKDVYRLHREELEQVLDGEPRERLLVELNVREQVGKLASSPVLEQARKQGFAPKLHGWVYDPVNYLIWDLNVICEPEVIRNPGLRR